jgi:hypothetical protein
MRNQMRVDHSFFVTRTFSLRSSFLWQMQTNVSYVGAYGLLSDCNVLVHWVIVTCSKTRHLGNYWIFQAPEFRPLMREEDPCHLRSWVTRHSPNQNTCCDNITTKIEHGWNIFATTVSGAWRIVEFTFGILANKWRIFCRPIFVKPYICESISDACCVLHDYVRKNDGIQFEDTLCECLLKVDRLLEQGAALEASL